MQIISASSTEYVLVEVTYTLAGVASDPTDDYTPHLAFMERGANPVASFADDDWHEAQWETVAGRHFARCLVGPKNGGVPLVAGIYRVWLGLDGPIEEPVLDVADLSVT